MPWEPHDGMDLSLISASILIVSDSLFSGETSGHEDVSGQLALDYLSDASFESINLDYYPDEYSAIMGKVESDVSAGVGLILLIGGTGVAPRDVTAEAVDVVIKKFLPGFGEEFRRRSYEEVGDRAILSRAVAGVKDKSFIVALPGSPNAVKTGIDIISSILPHIMKLVRP